MKDKIIAWIIGGIVVVWLLSGFFAGLFVKKDPKTKSPNSSSVEEYDVDSQNNGAFTPYEW